MRRRSRAGGEPAKKRHRRTVTLKRSNAEKDLRRRSRPTADQQTEIARLTSELHEALERQTATSDVLRLISSTPSELEPVFQTILANATRICEAKFGNFWLREGSNFRIAATHGAPSAYREYLQREPVVVPDSASAMGRIAASREAVQLKDISKAATHGMKMRLATIKLAKAQSGRSADAQGK